MEIIITRIAVVIISLLIYLMIGFKIYALIKSHLRDMRDMKGRMNSINTVRNRNYCSSLLYDTPMKYKVMIAWPICIFFLIGYSFGEYIYKNKIKNEEDMIASWIL